MICSYEPSSGVDIIIKDGHKQDKNNEMIIKQIANLFSVLGVQVVVAKLVSEDMMK